MLKLKKKKGENPAKGAKKKPAAAAKKPQGIVAQGNALRDICRLAGLAALVPIALGFVYLLLIYTPAIERTQIQNIADAYAQQQADSISRLLINLEERVQSAAKSPLALSAIASQSDEDIILVEKAILDYFPEVSSLHLIPIGDLGTADLHEGSRGLRNLIEVDMVRRASIGEEPEPQSYQFEGEWLSSITSLVTHPRYADRQAVFIMTMDNKALAQQLASLHTDAGKFTLEQVYVANSGKAKIDAIAQAGKGSGTDLGLAPATIPDTSWQVVFDPSADSLASMRLSRLPLLAALGLTALALLGALYLINRRFGKKLSQEVEAVALAADNKSPLELKVPQLVDLAKQLRRATLRSLRQSSRTASEAPGIAGETERFNSDSSVANLTNPIFQSDNLFDDDEELELDLPSNLQAEGAMGADDGYPSHIFRAYDVRGHADKELTDEMVSDIGKAIGTLAGEMGEQALLVGCDGRKSSPRIKSTLIRALVESGRDVIDIGMVPTPLLYFATRHLACNSGVMVTGSHNPAEDNGLKIVLQQQTIAAGGIQDIRERAAAQTFSSGNGRVTREDIIPAYQDAVLQDIAIAVPLKIVIDASNGATSDIAPVLFEDLGCEVIELNCAVDGNFPGHSPDTSKEENLKDLAAMVRQTEADFGVAFDGDGDRLAVVTGSGEIVRSDVLLMLYAQDVVSRNPGADVVFDVKCSHHLTDLVTRHGGRPVLWKTGHAFMKEKMAETGALLGGEFSGHMFFGERWYGFDDGMYAAGRLAEILSTHGESLDDCIANFPTSVSTPEIRIPVADNYKFDFVRKIIANADFSTGKVNTMDGLRVDFSNGWGLVRASNTGPALTMRFEADTEENLEVIQDEFRAQLALIDPSIELTF